MSQIPPNGPPGIVNPSMLQAAPPQVPTPQILTAAQPPAVVVTQTITPALIVSQHAQPMPMSAFVTPPTPAAAPGLVAPQQAPTHPVSVPVVPPIAGVVAASPVIAPPALPVLRPVAVAPTPSVAPVVPKPPVLAPSPAPAPFRPVAPASPAVGSPALGSPVTPGGPPALPPPQSLPAHVIAEMAAFFVNNQAPQPAPNGGPAPPPVTVQHMIDTINSQPLEKQKHMHVTFLTRQRAQQQGHLQQPGRPGGPSAPPIQPQAAPTNTPAPGTPASVAAPSSTPVTVPAVAKGPAATPTASSAPTTTTTAKDGKDAKDSKDSKDAKETKPADKPPPKPKNRNRAKEAARRKAAQAAAAAAAAEEAEKAKAAAAAVVPPPDILRTATMAAHENAPEAEATGTPAGRNRPAREEGFRGTMRGEIARMMYACGDVQEPDVDTVDYLEDMCVEFLADFCRPIEPMRPTPNAPRSSVPLRTEVLRHRLASHSYLRKYLSRWDDMTYMAAELAASRNVAAPSHTQLIASVGKGFLGLDEQDGAASSGVQGTKRRAPTSAEDDAANKRKQRPPKEPQERKKPGPKKGWKRNLDPNAPPKRRSTATRPPFKKPTPGVSRPSAAPSSPAKTPAA